MCGAEQQVRSTKERFGVSGEKWKSGPASSGTCEWARDELVC